MRVLPGMVVPRYGSVHESRSRSPKAVSKASRKDRGFGSLLTRTHFSQINARREPSLCVGSRNMKGLGNKGLGRDFACASLEAENGCVPAGQSSMRELGPVSIKLPFMWACESSPVIMLCDVGISRGVLAWAGVGSKEGRGQRGCQKYRTKCSV